MMFAKIYIYLQKRLRIYTAGGEGGRGRGREGGREGQREGEGIWMEHAQK